MNEVYNQCKKTLPKQHKEKQDEKKTNWKLCHTFTVSYVLILSEKVWLCFVLKSYRKSAISACVNYSKTCVKWPLSKRPKIGFRDQLSLNAGQSIAVCSKGSVLQYFGPSLSYHLSLISLVCLFLSGLLYRICQKYSDRFAWTNSHAWMILLGLNHSLFHHYRVCTGLKNTWI